MKLRIKGNSIRIRLSKSEVDKLASGSSLIDSTNFVLNSFTYKVQIVNDGEGLTASFEKSVITLYVPAALLADWRTNSVVGFESMMLLKNSGHLHLLLEKDFKCLDKAHEDQSDFLKTLQMHVDLGVKKRVLHPENNYGWPVREGNFL